MAEVALGEPAELSPAPGHRLTSITGPGSRYVKLNVGGSLHYTTIATLTKQDSMLRAMFSGRFSPSHSPSLLVRRALRCLRHVQDGSAVGCGGLDPHRPVREVVPHHPQLPPGRHRRPA